MATIDPPLVEARAGVPKRAGVWRRTPAEMPQGLDAGEAYVVVDDRWVRVTPWLPLRLQLGLRLLDMRLFELDL